MQTKITNWGLLVWFGVNKTRRLDGGPSLCQYGVICVKGALESEASTGPKRGGDVVW